MKEIEKLYLELKTQIWENAYNVKDNHWTQMVLNLDLIMHEFKINLEILEILKKVLNPSFLHLIKNEEEYNKVSGWLKS